MVELQQMAEEREKEDFKNAENDIVSKINKKNLLKQKELDSQTHDYLMKKKNEEVNTKGNPYIRRECKPINIINLIENQKNPVEKEEVVKVKEEVIEEIKGIPIKEQFKNKIDNQKKIVENLKLNCNKLMKVYGKQCFLLY